MSSFHLTIVCPDGCLFDDEADFIRLRTTEGDVGILANHINYTAAIGMGECEVHTGEETRFAACIGGIVTVADNEVSVISTTFEWKEDIDVERARLSLQRAEQSLAEGELTGPERQYYEARKRRALVRIGVAEKK